MSLGLGFSSKRRFTRLWRQHASVLVLPQTQVSNEDPGGRGWENLGESHLRTYHQLRTPGCRTPCGFLNISMLTSCLRVHSNGCQRIGPVPVWFVFRGTYALGVDGLRSVSQRDHAISAEENVTRQSEKPGRWGG